MAELTLQQAFELALQNHQAGRLAEAEPIYRQILGIIPNQLETLHYLGVLVHQAGHHEQALELLGKALALRPDWAEALSNQGEVLRSVGQLEAAAANFQRAIAIEPDYCVALSNLGNVLTELGRADEAVAFCQRAVALDPNYAPGWYNLANALHAQGLLDQAFVACQQALKLTPNDSHTHNLLGVILLDQNLLPDAAGEFRQSLALDPNLSDAHNNLGVTLQALGELDESINACQRAVALKPDYVEAYYNLGNALKENGQSAPAVTAYQQAIALKPDYIQAHCNLGNAFQDLGELDAAIVQYRKAIEIDSTFAEAYSNLGNVLRIKGQHDAALAAHRQAIALSPGYAAVQRNFGIALQTKGEVDAALDAYQHAVKLNPEYAEAYCDLGNVLKDKGQIEAAISAYRQAIAYESRRAIAYSNYLLACYYHPRGDSAMIAEELSRWQAQHAAPLFSEIKPHANDRTVDRRLRIGYVSPDLRKHPVGRFLLPLLEHHDRTQYEIFAYAQLANPDDITEKLRANTDTWRCTVGLSDVQLAETIRADRIDILIDLAMHTAHNRLLVFARKPAPVQANYLAYVGSAGLTTMDYRLSDPWLDPPGMDESIYCEKTIRLPETYWCYCPAENEPLPTVQASSETTLRFGCLNNFCKINDPLVETWAEILRRVPDSCLRVHALEGSHRQQLLERFTALGIVATRVEFIGHLPRAEYFRAYHSLDITLDTTPYAGGTTTCDALWMGVPVVTLAGERAVGRGGVSILNNIGLPQLVAQSTEEYIEIAVALAHDRARLQKLRSTLRERMLASPLMNAPRFARHVEAAYREMWTKWCMDNKN